ncbi:MAG TPA: DinB family protein [Ktedonobacterales bacterium]|jgi:uncharacterized damage-inducible protein DinB
MSELADQLVETWAIHCRIVLYVLDAISAEALTGVGATGKGRSVGAQFAHLHNVRLMWLKSASPALLNSLAPIEAANTTDKDALRSALDASAAAIGALLRQALESNGRIKGFKPHAAAFVGYLIAHESFHLGDICVVLTQSGHPLDKKVAYGMWEWGVR